MKLIKILIAIVLIFVLVVFFYQNYSLNPDPIWIWLYPGKEYSLSFAMLMALTLMTGVIIGFATAVSQIIIQKRETLQLRTRVKKLRGELDTLRNQSIEDDIPIKDTSESLEV